MAGRCSAAARHARSRMVPAAGLALAAIAAAAGAWLVGSRPVDISLDLDAPALEGVTARWDGGQCVLEETATEFAPHRFRVEVVPPEPTGGAPAPGLQLVAMAGIGRVSLSPASAWTNVSTYFFLHGAERPARLTISGWNLGPKPYLSFESDQRSGTVEVSSGNQTPVLIDLYSETRGKVVYPIQCDERLYRFYGRVPAKTLPELTLHLPGGERPGVRRLFVNALLPRVFYSEQAPSPRPSGIVREGWAPTWQGDGLTFPDAFYLGAHFWAAFAILFAAFALVFLAAPAALRGGLALLRAAWAARVNQDAIAPFRLRVFAAFWAPLAIAWLIFLLTFYPGTMNLDSLDQWRQAQTLSFEHGHPPFYAILMWGVSRVWNSPASVALVQILAGAAVLAYGFTLLWRAGVPKWLVAGAYLLALISMRNATMMIALIKDTPYGICMLAAAVLLARILLFRRDGPRWTSWASPGGALGLMALFRYNGPHVLAALVPLLAVILLRRWRGVALCAGVALSVTLGVNHGVFPVLKVEKGTLGVHNLLACHLAILVDRDVPMSNEEYAFLDQVRPLSDRWAYYERRGDSTTRPFLDCYNGEWARTHYVEFSRLHRGLVARNLLLASRYFWDRGSYLFVPCPTDIDMEKSFLGITPNDQGLVSMQYFLDLPDAFRGYLRWTESPGASWLFWRPAIPLYLALAACAMLCVRARDISWVLVYAPFFINTGVLMLSAISHNARYQYPLTLSAGFLVALAFLPARVIRPSETSPLEEAT